jgi:phosphoribosylamine--glycine ligase
MPGNPGTMTFCQNVPIDYNDFDKLSAFCLEQNIHLVVVGPENPLANGMVDYFLTHHTQIMIIGPDKEAAQLESSKEFAKDFMNKYQIPTAGFHPFAKSQKLKCEEFIKGKAHPIVIKADGLAAGKGVLVSASVEESLSFIKDIWENDSLGTASDSIIIEEFLSGVEVSVFILTDGNDYILLPEARDHKRIGEGNTGPNTGGMGTVSPVSYFDDNFKQKVIEKVILPTLKGIKEEQLHYKGFIFFGLMKVGDEPFVIEYNVRMGDPETQSVMMRLQSDLLPLLVSTFDGTIEGKAIEFNEESVVTVVLASEGYPGKYRTGKEISGLEFIEDKNVVVFHAGTKQSDNKIVTNGGRVLAITSKGNSIEEARQRAYQAIDKIEYEAKVFRRDIGL